MWLPSGEEAEVVHDGSKRALYFLIRAQNASDGSASEVRYPPPPRGAARAEEQKGRKAEEQEKTNRTEEPAIAGLRPVVGA